MNTYGQKTLAVTERLKKHKIVPVLALEKLDDGLRMCEILSRCGLGVAEITFRTAAAESIIIEAVKAFPDLLIGAGTVLNTNDLHRAFVAGAAFAVAPGFNPVIVSEAVKNEYVFFPGISCPTHIEQAYALGVSVMKFFPAEAAGGIQMLKAMTAPYRHLGIKFMPTGGITAENVLKYLEIPEVVAAGGTWLGSAVDVKAGAWDKIEQAVKDAINIIK